MFLEARKPRSSWLWTGERPTVPLSTYQYALTANLYLKLFRVAHITPSQFASDWTPRKAPPSTSGFQVIGAYQAMRPLINWRKQLPPSPTRLPDPSHLPPPKPSSDAPSPTTRQTKPRTAMVYRNFAWKADCIATFNRADAVLQARLRLGHTSLLKVYTHLLYPAADPTYPLCKEEPQTLEQ